MALLKIVKESDDLEFLRRKSAPVTEITPRILTFCDIISLRRFDFNLIYYILIH